MESPGHSSLDNLTGLGLRSGLDMRPTLIRVLTDLYVQKLSHTPDEERHYTELALRLLDAVDAPTRAAVAARLSRHLSPPLRVIQRLATDLPDIAAPVRDHAVLQPVTEVSEPEPASMPVAEAAAPSEPDSAIGAVEAAAVAIASDVASELNELFLAASAHERRLILLNLEVVAPLPSDRVERTLDAAAGQRLEAAALARSREDFAQYLAQALHIPRAQARRIASDDLGEPIVVAARALAMPRDVLYRILMFINTAVGHSAERIQALATLYDELPIEAAKHMVAIWQALQKDERATRQHRPFLGNDEARIRARTASAAVRRAPSAQRPTERRDAS